MPQLLELELELELPQVEHAWVRGRLAQSRMPPIPKNPPLHPQPERAGARPREQAGPESPQSE